jgi:predicted site-specific integrase-resolvase
MDEEFLTAEEARSILSVSRQTLLKYRKAGVIKTYCRGVSGYNIVFKAKDVQKLLTKLTKIKVSK